MANTDRLAARRAELAATLQTMFTKVTVLEAEGARVALTSCTECGAAVLLDPRDTFDARQVHMASHGHRLEDPPPDPPAMAGTGG